MRARCGLGGVEKLVQRTPPIGGCIQNGDAKSDAKFYPPFLPPRPLPKPRKFGRVYFKF